jgi:hypothetical protein
LFEDETVPGANFWGEKTVTCAGLLLVVTSDTVLAMVINTDPLGVDEGAVYSPDAVMVPEVGDPPAIPFTLHLELARLGLPPVTLNCRLCPASTRAALGVT